MSAEHPAEKASNEKDERQWSELSTKVVKRIYSFLNRSDQFNISLVCNSWLKVYEDPSLWETFVFKDSENVTKIGWKYSDLFQHVKIDCTMPPNCNRWCRQLIAFLHHITSNSQLVSVLFEGIVWSASIENLARADVYRAIGNFLRSQQRLEKLVFDGFFVKFGDFVDLMQLLSSKSKDTLQHLELKGLEICDSLETEDRDLDAAAQDLLSFAGLGSLTILDIDYELIFEKAVKCFEIKISEYSPSLALSTITFCYDNTDIHMDYYRGLKSVDWEFLTKLYPHLQVKSIITTNSPSLEEIETLIAPEIPITQLDYAYDDSLDHPSSMDIDALFNHILVNNICEALVSLNLVWYKRVPNLEATFIPILRACKKLKSLELVVASPENGIGFLLEFFSEKSLESLSEVTIFIADINENDYRAILADSAESVSFLRNIGLNVKIYLHS